MSKKDTERMIAAENEALSNCGKGDHCFHDFDTPPTQKHRRFFLNHGCFCETERKYICCWCGEISLKKYPMLKSRTEPKGE